MCTVAILGIIEGDADDSDRAISTLDKLYPDDIWVRCLRAIQSEPELLTLAGECCITALTGPFAQSLHAANVDSLHSYLTERFDTSSPTLLITDLVNPYGVPMTIRRFDGIVLIVIPRNPAPFFDETTCLSWLAHEMIHAILKTPFRILDEGLAVWGQLSAAQHFGFTAPDQLTVQSQITSKEFRDLIRTDFSASVILQKDASNSERDPLKFYRYASMLVQAIESQPTNWPSICEILRRDVPAEPNLAEALQLAAGVDPDTLASRLGLATDQPIPPTRQTEMAAEEFVRNSTEVMCRAEISLNPNSIEEFLEQANVQYMAGHSDDPTVLCYLGRMLVLKTSIEIRCGLRAIPEPEAIAEIESIIQRTTGLVGVEHGYVQLLTAMRLSLDIMAKPKRMELIQLSSRMCIALDNTTASMPNDPGLKLAVAQRLINTPVEYGGSPEEATKQLKSLAELGPPYTQLVEALLVRNGLSTGKP